MSFRWKRLKRQIYNNNKNYLKLIDYLTPKNENEHRLFNHCFFALNFDLSSDEVRMVLDKSLEIGRSDPKLTFLFSSYVLISYFKLYEAKVALDEIRKKVLALIDYILNVENVFFVVPIQQAVEA